LFGVWSSEAAEEEGLGSEIQQHGGVWLEESPLNREHNSKHGSQAREERIGEMDE
jgi:hypothetical protein